MMRPEVVALRKAIQSWKTTIDANVTQIEECFTRMFRDLSQTEYCEATILCKRRENAALRCLIKDAEARIALLRIAIRGGKLQESIRYKNKNILSKGES